MMDYEGLEKELQQFEQDEWGTNEWCEIQRKIWLAETENRMRRMTGMKEEQADWEADLE